MRYVPDFPGQPARRVDPLGLPGIFPLLAATIGLGGVALIVMVVGMAG